MRKRRSRKGSSVVIYGRSPQDCTTVRMIAVPRSINKVGTSLSSAKIGPIVFALFVMGF